MKRNDLRVAAGLGLVITVLFWFDPLFIPLALLGPLVVGAAAAWSGLPCSTWHQSAGTRPRRLRDCICNASKGRGGLSPAGAAPGSPVIYQDPLLIHTRDR